MGPAGAGIRTSGVNLRDRFSDKFGLAYGYAPGLLALPGASASRSSRGRSPSQEGRSDSSLGLLVGPFTQASSTCSMTSAAVKRACSTRAVATNSVSRRCFADRPQPLSGAESPRSAARTDRVVESRSAISASGRDVESSGDRSVRWYGTNEAEVLGRAALFRPFVAAACRCARRACSARGDPVDPLLRSRVCREGYGSSLPRPLGVHPRTLVQGRRIATGNRIVMMTTPINPCADEDGKRAR